MVNKSICKIDKAGNQWWFLNDLLHREDGPAIIRINGIKEYYIHNKRHRLDGPAYICNTGVSEWYINDYYVTSEIYQWAKEHDIDLDNLTDVDKALIKISFT